MDGKSSDWRPTPTVCRCCLAEGCYKDISTEYFWMGKREVYSEMLLQTLDVTIAYSQSGGPNSNSRLICEPCISRLRDATEFKKQVLECEKTFMQHLDPGRSDVIDNEAVTVDAEEKDIKLDQVKQEKEQSSDDDFNNQPETVDDDDDDDLDNQPLTKLASKVPKKESVDFLDLLDNTKAAEKRKSTIKLKTPAVKRGKTKSVEAKPTASKTKAAEKKKKEMAPVSRLQMVKRNAEVVLQYATAYPFRQKGMVMKCVYCRDEYDDPSKYRRHMDEFHRTFKLSTVFAHTGRGCYKEFIKVDISDLKCRICLTPSQTIDEMAKHLHDYHRDKAGKLNLNYDVGMQPYKLERDKWFCCLCNAKLPSLIKLCRHTITHYKKYTCEVCGRSYLTNDALRYHIRCSHSGSNVCRKCWQGFSTPEEKREHLTTSKKCWTFCCIKCGERFRSWETKRAHQVEAHGFSNNKYTCPDCGEVFDHRKVFYTHFKLTHTDESFVCSCCGLKFGTKNLLENHRLCHTGEKLYKCTVCMKAFPRNKSLIQHMWIHSEKKRFVCFVCNKQFAQKVSLKSHIKSHHPDAILGL